MLGKTSSIFLLEASSLLPEGGHVLNLLLQIWDSFVVSSVSPWTPIFLCNTRCLRLLRLLVTIPVALFCPRFSSVSCDAALPCCQT